MSQGKNRGWLCRAAALAAALMMLMMPSALAAGNKTIAVQGQNGFDDYISSMLVWGDRLLMTSWDKLYFWSPETDELVAVEGYDELQSMPNGVPDENGVYTLTFGEDELEFDQSESLSRYSTMIPIDGKLYSLYGVYGEEGNTRALLLEIDIAEDGTPSFVGAIDLGDALTVDYGDGSYGMMDLQNPCYADGLLYALSYGDNGREVLVLDVQVGTVDTLTLETDLEVNGLAAYGEGRLLMIAVDYSGDYPVTSLLVYDIAGETLSELGVVPTKGYSYPGGVVFDEARSMLYYSASGSVWRCPVTETGLGEPEEFGDMPLEVYTDAAAVLLGDLYIVSSYEGVVGRDVTLDKLPEQRLRIGNGSGNEEIRTAYYAFTDAHPEYLVSISSVDSGAVLQDMMNRSEEIDLYTVSSDDLGFQALMERGFMAELGGSQTLRESVEAMYPALRDNMMKDGELYAVPMGIWSSCLTLNTQLLTQEFGFTQEELPQNWLEMFALLADLADGRMQDVPEASLLDPGYIRDDARQQIFSLMLQDYFLWLEADEANLARGSEVLIGLCEAFEQIDWDGFGMPEEYDSDGSWEYNPENIIMSTTSIDVGSWYEESQTPTPLAIEEGGKPLIAMSATVAFVNPFSKHREAAIEYLETAYGLLKQRTLMQMDPSINEPIENEYYEESLSYYDQSIAEMETALETAEDEETREQLMQNLEDMKGYREDFLENGRWDVSSGDIERYRAVAGMLTLQQESIWGSGAYTQVQQYLDGALSAQQLASELEKTLQMRRLEGN